MFRDTVSTAPENRRRNLPGPIDTISIGVKLEEPLTKRRRPAGFQVAPSLAAHMEMRASNSGSAASLSAGSLAAAADEIEDFLNDGSEESDGDDEQEFRPNMERADLDFAEELEPEDLPVADQQQQLPLPPAVSEDVLFPHGLFHYQWTNFPNPPIPASKRRERFVGTPGPTRQLVSPYEAFTAIWDRAIMEKIVEETNRYAQKTLKALIARENSAPKARILRWKDTSVDELYVYFAVTLSTAMCLKTDVKEYFYSMQSLVDTPYFAKYMTYDRYLLLNKCLHFVDNTSVASNLPKKEAKIAKIKLIIDFLNQRFEELYNLHQNIVIDESLTQWKGCLEIKQYITNKAASEGIKTYELCESDTGYLWRFEVYAGGHEVDPALEVTPISGVTPSLVQRLVHGLHYKGHTLWMDNYFNSPALARYLKSHGIDCVGTLRTNRKFVPEELSSLTESDMSVGDVYGCTSGDVDIITFCHKRKVSIISTYHGVAVSTSQGSNESKPIAILDYNLRMGGVGKKDQMLAMYLTERKRTKVWYKKFFRRLLNVSVANSLILHRQSQSREPVKENRKFRYTLIKQLLEHHSIDKAANLFEPIRTLTLSNQRSRAMLAAGAIEHFPTLFGYDDTGRRNKRRHCTLCKKQTISNCPGCNVTLCPFTCHKEYHKS